MPNSLWMVANGEHFFHHRKLGGGSVLGIDEGEEEGLVGGHIAPLQASLSPGNVAKSPAQFPLLPLQHKSYLYGKATYMK